MAKKTEWPRTIASELFDAWQGMRRKKDPQVIAEKLGVSRPIITRALNHGNVTKDGLVEKINTFFRARIESEKDTATELNELNF